MISTSDPVTIQANSSHDSQFFQLQAPFLITRETADASTDSFNVSQYSLGTYINHELKQSEYSIRNPLHQHEFIEIMFVLSGTVVNHIENHSFVYQPGQCCVMNPNIRHCEEILGTYDILFLMIRDDCFVHIQRLIDIENMLLERVAEKDCITRLYEDSLTNSDDTSKIYLDFLPVVPPERLFEQILPLFKEMRDTILDESPGAYAASLGLMIRFFHMLSSPDNYSMHATRSDISRTEYLVNQTLQIIEASHGKCTHTDIERQLHYNAEYLNRLLRQYTGYTFSQHCTKAVLSRAARLLSDTDLTITDIIDRVGFSNRNHFYKIFARQYSMSPKAYRQKMRGSN